MEERYVRCRRCHGVFEAGLPNCSRCGAAFVPVAASSSEEGASYADKYLGTEFAPAVAEVPLAAPARRPGLGLFLGAGVVLIVIAVAFGGLAAMGAFVDATPTPRPMVVVAATPSPTPVPTLPTSITNTLAKLGDPNFNCHVATRTKILVNARVSGRSVSVIVNIDTDMSAGDEGGTVQTGNLTSEFRIVGGVYYSRTLPVGKWAAKVAIPPFLMLSPIFSITEPRQLTFDGEDKSNGGAYRLESTGWWVPDVGKLSGYDVNQLGILPQKVLLTLWVGTDGMPVYAVFHAWTDASDGTHLLDVTTTYTFTNVGIITPVDKPIK
jgi:hypothetical protein